MTNPGTSKWLCRGLLLLFLASLLPLPNATSQVGGLNIPYWTKETAPFTDSPKNLVVAVASDDSKIGVAIVRNSDSKVAFALKSGGTWSLKTTDAVLAAASSVQSLEYEGGSTWLLGVFKTGSLGSGSFKSTDDGLTWHLYQIGMSGACAISAGAPGSMRIRDGTMICSQAGGNNQLSFTTANNATSVPLNDNVGSSAQATRTSSYVSFGSGSQQELPAEYANNEVFFGSAGTSVGGSSNTNPGLWRIGLDPGTASASVVFCSGAGPIPFYVCPSDVGTVVTTQNQVPNCAAGSSSTNGIIRHLALTRNALHVYSCTSSSGSNAVKGYYGDNWGSATTIHSCGLTSTASQSYVVRPAVVASSQTAGTTFFAYYCAGTSLLHLAYDVGKTGTFVDNSTATMGSPCNSADATPDDYPTLQAAASDAKSYVALADPSLGCVVNLYSQATPHSIGASATVAVTALIAFDVDPLNNVLVVKDGTSPTIIETRDTSTLAQKSSVNIGCSSPRIDGVMAYYDRSKSYGLAGFLDCSSGASYDRLKIRDVAFQTPTCKYSFCGNSAADWDLTQDQAFGAQCASGQQTTFPVNAQQIGNVHAVALTYQNSHTGSPDIGLAGFAFTDASNGRIGFWARAAKGTQLGIQQSAESCGMEIEYATGASVAQICAWRGPDGADYIAAASTSYSTRVWRLTIDYTSDTFGSGVPVVNLIQALILPSTFDNARGVACQTGNDFLLVEASDGSIYREQVIGNGAGGAPTWGPVTGAAGLKRGVTMSEDGRWFAWLQTPSILGVGNATTGAATGSFSMPAGTHVEMRLSASGQVLYEATSNNIARYVVCASTTVSCVSDGVVLLGDGTKCYLGNDGQCIGTPNSPDTVPPNSDGSCPTGYTLTTLLGHATCRNTVNGGPSVATNSVTFGGVGGACGFPGLDIVAASRDLGMSQSGFCGMLAGIVLLAFTAVGAFAGAGGSAVGAARGARGGDKIVLLLGGAGLICGLFFDLFFGLIAIWVVILLFMLATAGVVLGFTRGSAA